MVMDVVCSNTTYQPEVSDGMSDSSDPLPPEFFANPRCPLALTATKVTTTEVDQSKVTKDLEKSASVGNQS